MPVIRIDDAVWRELQMRAVGLKDTPNSALRRVLKIDTESAPSGETVFDLLVKYITATSGRQKSKVMAEIKRRFITFGWVQPGPTK